MTKLTLALALAIAMVALAANAMAANWSLGTVTISKIEVSDDGTGANISLLISPAVRTTCSLGGGGQWAVGGSADNIKNILSLATAAKLAGRRVNLYLSGRCSGNGTAGYPVMVGLRVN